MKKIFCLILALAASLMVCAASFAAERKNLVVLGDSITTGYGLPGYVSGDNYSAKDSFGNRLGRYYDNYANYAVDGRTTAELLTALDNAEITAKIQNADSVVVSIGGNDYLVPLFKALIEAVQKDEELMSLFMNDGSTPSEADLKRLAEKLGPVMTDAVNAVDINKTFDNLNGIFSKIKKLNPDCEIVTLTVYNPFEGNKEMEFFDKTSETMTSKLNTKIYAAAGINGIKVIDVYTAFRGNPLKYTNISTMDVHPSVDGHGLIFDKLTEVLGIEVKTEANPETVDFGITTVFCVAMLCSAAAISTRKKR